MENLEFIRSVSERTHKKLAMEWLMNKRYCDAILETDDGFQIEVHKSLLMASSSFFKSLFQERISRVEGVVYLHEIPMSILQIIVRWVYTRNSKEINNENVTDVIVHADYFVIPMLVKQCTAYILNHLELDICIHLLKFSRFYNLSQLEKGVHSFVLNNFARVCDRQENLEILNKEDLKEFFSNDEVNADELQLFEIAVRWASKDDVSQLPFLSELLSEIRFWLLPESVMRESVLPHRYIMFNETCFDVLRPYIPVRPRISQEYAQIRRAFGLRMPRHIVLAIGGWGWGLEGPSNKIEVYIPGMSYWMSIAETDPSGPRAYHGMVLYEDHLYIMGGLDGNGHLNTCRSFNVISRTWKELSPMHSRRCYISAVVLDAEIYVMGGNDGQHLDRRMDSVEKYNPKTNQWTFVSPMNRERSDAGVTTLNGKIYIVGGFNGDRILSSAEEYDPRVDTWTLVPSLPTPRSGLSCVTIDDAIYALGGYDGDSRQKIVESYRPGDEGWISIPDAIWERSNFGATVFNDTLMVAGGYRSFGVLSMVENFSLDNQRWSLGVPMRFARSALKLCTLVDVNHIRGYLKEARENLTRRMLEML